MKTIDKTLLFFSALVGIWSLNACTNGAPSTNASFSGIAQSTPTPSPTPVVTPGTTPAPGSQTSTVTVPLTTFQVTQDFTPTSNPGNNPDVVTYLHRTSNAIANDLDWTNPCSISSTEPNVNNRYIGCTLEVNELDLWFNRFALNWGAAVGMCSYVEVDPYWFFQYKADITGAADGIDVSYTVCGTNPPVFDGVAGGDAGGKVGFKGTPEALFCANDYSWNTSNPGPNCCEGNYNLTITTCDQTCSPASCKPSTTTVAWTGKYGNCAAGPAADAGLWNHRTRFHNYPTGVTYESILGIGEPLFVNSPATAPGGIFGSDIWSANAFTGVMPKALSDVTSLSPETYLAGPGGPLAGTGPVYAFICFDQAREAIARIDLTVRKWDTYTEIQKQQNGNPAVTGNELPFPGDKLDYFGWDNFVGDAAHQQYPNSIQYPNTPGPLGFDM